MKNNKKKGFTLIELLVVIAILAILATVSIVGYTSFLNKARMSVDQQLVDQINNVIAAESVIQPPADYTEVDSLLKENGFNSPLVPSYSKYKFAYLADENVMVLVENGKIVYPEKYQNKSIENLEYVIDSNSALDAALALEGNVKVNGDLLYATYNEQGISRNENVKITEGDKTITVSAGKTLMAGGSWGAIQVTDSAKLTLNGAGTISGDLGSDDASTAVFAQNNAVVKITDGYYTNEHPVNAENDGSYHADLIYARDNARIEISGGTFKSATPEWTLNCKDGHDATIIVSGGMFYQFNPETARPEDHIEIASGYKAVPCDENGTENAAGEWYKVVKAN